MPTYNAVGISASLTVANLQASCSNVFDLRMGAEQRKDAKRIDSVFATGQKLTERVLGADGAVKGALQFVGDNEDLPLFVVEAGESVRYAGLDDGMHEEGAKEYDDDAGADVDAPEDSDADESESPLTSLGATPNAGTLSFGSQQAPPSPLPAFGGKRAKKARTEELEATSLPFDRARGFLDAVTSPQALCLTVQTSDRSFLPAANKAKRAGKDLKLEVFFNGELVGISFVNTRGSAVELKHNRVRFHGTRVHRQMEKPWIYDGKPAADDVDAVETGWDAIQKALEEEARIRGQNTWGDFSASGELLSALSRIQLPDRVRSQAGFGVVDLIITAGSGKKYGPDQGYVIGPKRMDDPSYTPRAAAPAVQDSFYDLMNLSSVAALPHFDQDSPSRNFSPSPRRRTQLTQSSPEVPLIKQRSQTAPLPQTPSRKKKAAEIAGELDLVLDGIDLSKHVSPFENARRKVGQKRTLKQRLQDLRQMNPKNQARNLEILKEELDEGQMGMLKQAISQQGDRTSESPSKKARLDVEYEFASLDMLANVALDLEHGTIDPANLFRQTSVALAVLDPQLDTVDADADAKLTQQRMDLALASGADFSGPLLQHLANTSPEGTRTPKKKTRASALANSPCSVPVKESPRKKASTPSPQKRNNEPSLFFPRIGSPIPIDPVLQPPSAPVVALDESPSKRTVRGANRTRNSWNPAEKTAEQAFKDFPVPKMCRGSKMGYAEGEDFKRQIGKARSGEFREEQVVVGMRFIVV